jgi:hypothetical protein
MNKSLYTSLEASKKLKELGIVQQADCYYCHYVDDYIFASKEEMKWINGEPKDQIAAFSVGELGLLLPEFQRSIYYVSPDWVVAGSGYSFRATTEAEARAKALIWLLENKKESPQAINQRYLNEINI